MDSVYNLSTTVLSAVGASVVAAGGIFWSLTKTPPPLRLEGIDYDNQSVITDHEKGIRGSPFTETAELSRGRFYNICTVYDIFQCGLYHSPDDHCLGHKLPNSNDYEWLTYKQVDDIAIKIGAGIIHQLKQLPGQNTILGVFMRNCVEWVYVDQCCCRYSMVAVALYDTLGEEACQFVINHVKCEVIFVDTEKKINFLLKTKPQLPYLRYIVTNNACGSDLVAMGRDVGIEILSFSELLVVGECNPHPLMLPKPDDIYTIFCTSGTTGTPKCCEINHKAQVLALGCTVKYLELIKFGKKKETHLSYLPLAHVYERTAQALMFMYSGRIAFYSGDMQLLLNEFKVFRPTIFFAVPRLLNKIYDTIMLNVNNRPIAKLLFNLGLAAKQKELEKGIIRKNSVWDFLIFRKMQELLGGQLEMAFIASAPVSADVLTFFRCVMGCTMIEVYGQTEISGPCTTTLPGDNECGHVGIPVSGTLIKLGDVPDLDISAIRDGKGEICVKGNLCIKQYYKNPEMTQKLIDSEGWLHTGDVGMWTEKGQLKVVDRCKHIFKLAQGEYLAPERLENVYSLSPLVAQIFVTGNSLKDYCVAIVVPTLSGWRSLGYHYSSIHELCNDKNSTNILLKNLAEIGRANKLLGFELVKRVFLWPTLLTVEDGLMTPTMKLKRAEVSKYFSEQIKQLYE